MSGEATARPVTQETLRACGAIPELILQWEEGLDRGALDEAIGIAQGLVSALRDYRYIERNRLDSPGEEPRVGRMPDGALGRICDGCGRVWRLRRRDARYHSNACRQAAYRARKRDPGRRLPVAYSDGPDTPVEAKP